jgi:uncharacterized protein YndB with AHSA1/START domain
MQNKDNNSANREILLTRIINAPRERVFKAWIEPEQVKQWWGPNGFTNTIHEMDVKPGGEWRFIMHGPDGTDYNNKIIFKEIDEPNRLVYTHVSGPVFHTTVTFEDAGGKTKLTFHVVFESVEEFNYTVEKFGAIEGAKQTLNRLEEYLLKSIQENS